MATTAMEKDAAKLAVATKAEVQQLHAELEALKKELSARITAMEELLPKKAEAAEENVPVPAETLAVIAVAVTAYLGKKVKIRAARFVPTASPWAQTGRAIVQASHHLQR
jgi:dsDNA-specific endonuclease/ATPase MutS2